MKKLGASLLLLAACLVLSMPAMSQDSLKEERITDLAGHNIIYYHGQNFIDQVDTNFYAPKYGQEMVLERMQLDLYNEPGVVSVMWVSETQKNITVDVLTEMYDRLNASGGDATKAILGTVNIGGIEWHTVSAPKKDQQGFVNVGMIAYTNGERTATVTMEESRPKLDNEGFSQTLKYVQFEKNPKTTPGLPLAYFF
jgi:hypothetical protein